MDRGGLGGESSTRTCSFREVAVVPRPQAGGKREPLLGRSGFAGREKLSSDGMNAAKLFLWSLAASRSVDVRSRGSNGVRHLD